MAPERRHHRDNEYLKKNHDNYRHKEEQQECQDAKSPVRLQNKSHRIVSWSSKTTREMSTLYHTFFFIF